MIKIIFVLLFVNLILTTSALRHNCQALSSTTQNTYGPFCYYDVGVGSNIIISAPHGGSKKPSVIPKRDYGCSLNGECNWSHTCGTKSSSCKAKAFKDMYTKEIAIYLADELEILTGIRPHLIVNELHRSKLDANREYNEATFNDSEAAHAFNQYHQFINDAKNSISGDGLFLDMHGQTHPEAWVELGYLLTKSNLNTNTIASSSSSIKALANRSNNFEEVLRGSKSLGFFLQQQNVKTVPSPTHHSPGSSGNYYSGGYNTKTHGSQTSGTIDGIQVEVPKIYRSSTAYQAFTKSLAEAVYDFMNENNY